MLTSAPALGVTSMVSLLSPLMPDRSMVSVKSSHGCDGAVHVWLRRDGADPDKGADALHVTVGLAADTVPLVPAAIAGAAPSGTPERVASRATTMHIVVTFRRRAAAATFITDPQLVGRFRRLC